MAYGVVHTSNLYGCAPFSFINFTDDIENGSLVAKGDLAPGEREIYECSAPSSTDAVFLVANPAWSYNNIRAVNQNEEEFINKAGRAFRGYEVMPNRRYRVSIDMLNGTPAVGEYISVNGNYKADITSSMPTGSAFVAKILDIDTIGYNMYVGSSGVINNTNQFVIIEVIKNTQQ